jgi:hypothetical protein
VACWAAGGGGGAAGELPRLGAYRDLEQTAKRIEAFQPEFVKVVSTAQTLADNLAVLRLIEDRSLSSQMVGIAMGEEGLVSRVLGPRAGAAFTFASFDDGSGPGVATAPGQVTARTLRDLYRVEQLGSGDARLRRGRQPHRPFAFAADAEHRLPQAKA